MESERLKKLNALANDYENRFDCMSDKTSKDYGIMMEDYKTIMTLIKQETERLNAIEKTKQEAERLELERDKLESNAQNERLRATIEEDKIKSQRRTTRWQIIGGGVVSLAVAAFSTACNLKLIDKTVDINNGGEYLNKFQEKAISFLRLFK